MNDVARHQKPCPCKCGTLGFCDEHLALLHRIRDELAEKAKKYGDRRKQKREAQSA